MLNSSSHGNNDLDDDYNKLKEQLKTVKKERTKYKWLHGELEYKFVVKDDDDMDTLKQKIKNLKAEAKKAKAMCKKKEKAGATRTTAENMKAYGKRVTAVNPAKLARDPTLKKNDIVHVKKGNLSIDAVVDSRLRTRKESYSVIAFEVQKGKRYGQHKFYQVAREDMTLKSKAKTPNVGDTVRVLVRPDAEDSEFVTADVVKVDGTKVTVFGNMVFDTEKDLFVIFKPRIKRKANELHLQAKRQKMSTSIYVNDDLATMHLMST
tara:strand:+ start:181 stop:972 length:792 start_codon:yes stop_codon:yes gene_type:complete